MKLAYQIATPEVRDSWGVTAYQKPLDQSFRRLVEIGYDGAELMVANPELIDSAMIRNLSGKYELPVSMICTGEIFGQEGVSFSLKDDAKRMRAIRLVKAAIRLAGELNCSYVNIGRVRGGYTPKGNHEEERALSVAGLKEVSAYAEDYGVKVLLEPVNSIASTFINRTQEGIDLIKEIALPHFGLMLDSNHMFIDDPDMFESLCLARNYVEYIHVADSNRLYPGNCKLDFDAFFDILHKFLYTSWISVEVFQRPDQETAIQESFRYLKPFMQRR